MNTKFITHWDNMQAAHARAVSASKSGAMSITTMQSVLAWYDTFYKRIDGIFKEEIANFPGCATLSGSAMLSYIERVSPDKVESIVAELKRFA